MKKISKTLLISILLFAIAITFVTPVLGAAGAGVDPSTYTGNQSVTTTKINEVGNKIITIISTIGSVASVIVLIVLGIKYMMGSAEEKAEYKKTMLPYIIGAVLIFAASTLAGVVFNFANSL